MGKVSPRDKIKRKRNSSEPSSPVVGSSKNMREGSEIISQPTQSLFFSPPEIPLLFSSPTKKKKKIKIFQNCGFLWINHTSHVHNFLQTQFFNHFHDPLVANGFGLFRILSLLSDVKDAHNNKKGQNKTWKHKDNNNNKPLWASSASRAT